MGVSLKFEDFFNLFMKRKPLRGSYHLVIDSTNFIYINGRKIWVNSKISKEIANTIYEKFVNVWPFVGICTLCFDGGAPVLKKSNQVQSDYHTSDCMVHKHLKQKLSTHNIRTYIIKSTDFGEGELKAKYCCDRISELEYLVYSNDNDIFMHALGREYQKNTWSILRIDSAAAYIVDYKIVTKPAWKFIAALSVMGNDYVPKIMPTNVDTLPLLKLFCCTKYMTIDEPLSIGTYINFVKIFSTFMYGIHEERWELFKDFVMNTLNFSTKYDPINDDILKMRQYMEHYQRNRKRGFKKYTIEHMRVGHGSREHKVVTSFILFWVRTAWYTSYCTTDAGLQRNSAISNFMCSDMDTIEFPWNLCERNNLDMLMVELTECLIGKHRILPA